LGQILAIPSYHWATFFIGSQERADEPINNHAAISPGGSVAFDSVLFLTPSDGKVKMRRFAGPKKVNITGKIPDKTD
jgi:hypothetical protein